MFYLAGVEEEGVVGIEDREAAEAVSLKRRKATRFVELLTSIWRYISLIDQNSGRYSWHPGLCFCLRFTL